MRQIYYRGSLDFCNYDCSYCPFSKRGEDRRLLERDREQLVRFTETMGREDFAGAVQIVPYGEALIHEYYWQAMAELSKLPGIQVVGAQSNFSFPVEEMLRVYQECGGCMGKLRLWGTFHPEMTTVNEFLRQCEKIGEAGVLFCAGAVGVPGNLDLLRQLREGLDQSVYFWTNKMDGLGRRYTQDEIGAFLELDRYFGLELRHFPADADACAESALVQGNGDIRPCVSCHSKMGNLYTDGLSRLPGKTCTREICECFLSYGGRSDISELLDFAPCAAFRIPRSGV